jgi:hypothetical protein
MTTTTQLPLSLIEEQAQQYLQLHLEAEALRSTALANNDHQALIDRYTQQATNNYNRYYALFRLLCTANYCNDESPESKAKRAAISNRLRKAATDHTNNITRRSQS